MKSENRSGELVFNNFGETSTILSGSLVFSKEHNEVRFSQVFNGWMKQQGE